MAHCGQQFLTWGRWLPEFVCDVVLNDFGCETEFNVNNPLDYMSRIGLMAKNNFFEKRVGEYTRVDIPTTTEGMFDEDF